MHFALIAWNQQDSNRILTTAITITWQHEKLQFSPVKTWFAIAPVSRVWQQDELEEELVEILLSFSFNCLGNFCKRVKIRTVCKEELYLELKLKPVDKALLWTKIKKSRIFDFGKKPRVPSSGAAIPKYFFKTGAFGKASALRSLGYVGKQFLSQPITTLTFLCIFPVHVYRRLLADVVDQNSEGRR